MPKGDTSTNAKGFSFSTSSILGFVFLLLALGINYYIIHFYIDSIHSPESHDLFFKLLPVLKLKYVLGWGVLINILLAVTACVLYRDRFPFVTRTIGLMYIVRAFFISITPLGVPADRVVPLKQNMLQEMAYNGNDFFFSGHVALPVLLAIIFWDIVWLRWSFLAMGIMFAFGVIAARTHYSIDVFAAPFIVYGIYVFCKKFFAKEFAFFAQKSNKLSGQ